MILIPVIVPVCDDEPVRTPARVQAQQFASRQALMLCAQQCGAPVMGWVKNEQEVPQPNDGFYWSVSHKRNWAAAVIADCAVGIDVEQLLPRDNQGVFDEVANGQEWDVLGGRSWDNFFRVWTSKEATLKANGLGIGAFSDCLVDAVIDEKHMALQYNGNDWLVEHCYHLDHIFSVTAVGDDVRWLIEPADNDSFVRENS